MPTYLYETIPSSSCEEPKHYEFQQSMNDAPLTHHPDTGEPIKRIILGGYGIIKSGGDSGTNPVGGCGSSGCC